MQEVCLKLLLKCTSLSKHNVLTYIIFLFFKFEIIFYCHICSSGPLSIHKRIVRPVHIITMLFMKYENTQYTTSIWKIVFNNAKKNVYELHTSYGLRLVISSKIGCHTPKKIVNLSLVSDQYFSIWKGSFITSFTCFKCNF